MSSRRSNQALSGLASSSHRIGRSRTDSQSSFHFDNIRPDRGSGSRGRGFRSRRNRSSRGRGNQRDSTPSRDSVDLPWTPEEWEIRLERERADAYLDLALSFIGTGIPLTIDNRIDLLNPGAVGGHEYHALMMAACRSMRLGRAAYPDGSLGRRLRLDVLEEEMARLYAGA